MMQAGPRLRQRWLSVGRRSIVVALAAAMFAGATALARAGDGAFVPSDIALTELLAQGFEVKDSQLQQNALALILQKAGELYLCTNAIASDTEKRFKCYKMMER